MFIVLGWTKRPKFPHIRRIYWLIESRVCVRSTDRMETGKPLPVIENLQAGKLCARNFGRRYPCGRILN